MRDCSRGGGGGGGGGSINRRLDIGQPPRDNSYAAVPLMMSLSIIFVQYKPR